MIGLPTALVAGRRGRSYDADAVVTGAGSGIGRALATEIARRGGRVLCADRDPAAAAATAATLGAAHGVDRARPATCDVTDHDAVTRLAGVAQDWFGGAPTLVVNNAGVGAGGARIGEDDLAEWHTVHAVNFWGVVHGCHVFVPRLRAAGRGAVLNVASAAAFGSAPRMGAYSTSKAAVVSLSETLAAETAGTPITVSVLCPTFVRTGILAAGGRTGHVTADAGALASRLMELTGRDPGAVAAVALDALDAGRLHVAPQIEAHLLWLFKRALPGPFVAAAGLAARLPDPTTLLRRIAPWPTT